MSIPAKTKLLQYTYRNGSKEKNLYVDIDGHFHVRIYHNGKVFTRKLLANRLMEAITERDEYIVSVRKEALGIISRKQMPSVEKAIKLWKEGKKGITTDAYIKTTSASLKRILKPILHYYIDKITTLMLKKLVMDYHNATYVKGGTTRKHTERTTNLIMDFIKSLFTYIYEETNYIPNAISPAKKLKPLTEPEKKRNVVSRATFKTFFAAVDDVGFFHLSFQIRAMFYLGLRSCEAVSMKWASYSPEDNTYTPGQHALTKGREATTLDIPPEMQVWFRKASEQHGKSLIYICINQHTMVPYCSRNLRYHLLDISKTVGMKLTPHSLRASYITMLSQKYDLPTVKELARHADIETTMLYVNVSKKRMKEAITNTFSNLA